MEFLKCSSNPQEGKRKQGNRETNNKENKWEKKETGRLKT